MDHAFTLIEVLLVIASLAILGSHLFRLFTQGKRATNGATHLRNLKGVSLAIIQYGNEYGDSFSLPVREESLTSLHPVHPTSSGVTL